MKAIKTLITTIILLGGFNITNAQDSYTFNKDSVFIYRIEGNWNIAPLKDFDPFDPMKNSTEMLPKTDTLKLTHTFNEQVIIDSLLIFYHRFYFELGEEESIDLFTLNNGSPYKVNRRKIDTLITYPLHLKTNNLTIQFTPIKHTSMYLYISNVKVFYHSNTSINEVINDNDIKLIDGRFITSLNIQNIKLYDITGKLIQEGTLNDKYDLQSNKLYFVLFDNKYTKKYAINN